MKVEKYFTPKCVCSSFEFGLGFVRHLSLFVENF